LNAIFSFERTEFDQLLHFQAAKWRMIGSFAGYIIEYLDNIWQHDRYYLFLTFKSQAVQAYGVEIK